MIVIVIGLQSEFNNGLLIQFDSKDHRLGNKTVTFPVAFKSIPKVLGVGFYIDTIGEQSVTSVTETSFTVTSMVRICYSHSWLAIGI